MRKPTEHQEQAAYFDFVRWQAVVDHRYTQIYAVPNGAVLAGDAKQRARQMNKLKKEGLRKGQLDINIDVPIPHPVEGFIFPGAKIEMKVGDNKPTKEQAQIIVEHRRYGYLVAICYNAAAAIAFTKQYMGIK